MKECRGGGGRRVRMKKKACYPVRDGFSATDKNRHVT